MKYKKCIFLKSDKTLCNAKPVKGSSLCFRHNPLLKEAQILASSKGGQNRRLQGVYGKEIALKTPEDIQSFLATVINGVWIGDIPVPVGSSMGFLTRCWLDSYEVATITTKIDEIKKLLEKGGAL